MYKSIPAALAAIIVLSLAFPLAAGAGWLDDLLGRNKSKQAEAGAPSAALSGDTISAGLKEALEVGTARVVDTLGRTDGFNADPAIRIPLPASLEDVQSSLARVGLSGTLDELELGLNRAAEAATPKAKALFIDAIRGLTLDDVMSIYKGPDDAATQYLRRQMAGPLATAMQPVVAQSLQ